MNEVEVLVIQMLKIVRNHEKHVLKEYLDILGARNFNLARIMADEVQDYYNERKNDSKTYLKLSDLSDKLYTKTMELYEENS